MRAGLFAFAWLLGSCATPPEPEAQAAPRGTPLAFAFGTLDGRVVTAESTRGRVTVLLFVATFDLPSQVAVRYLGDLHRTHVPKVNALAIVVEAAENVLLAQVFQKSLGISYPVALADSVELRAAEAFAGLDRVPALVVLDAEGRIAHRHVGSFAAHDLGTWVKAAQR